MNIPLILTFIRLIISPFVPAILLVFFLPGSTAMHMFLAGIFALMAVTDFFDGYLARQFKQETVAGKVLDPIADKMLVICTSIALVAIGVLPVVYALIIAAREILVMGMREFGALKGSHVAVLKIGKYKSVLQYVYITTLIAGYGSTGVVAVLGAVTMLVTISSGFCYCQQLLETQR